MDRRTRGPSMGSLDSYVVQCSIDRKSGARDLPNSPQTLLYSYRSDLHTRCVDRPSPGPLLRSNSSDHPARRMACADGGCAISLISSVIGSCQAAINSAASSRLAHSWRSRALTDWSIRSRPTRGRRQIDGGTRFIFTTKYSSCSSGNFHPNSATPNRDNFQ